MTKLEEIKLKKRELEENEDYLKEVDQTDGPKFVAQYETDKKEKEDKVSDTVKNQISDTGPVTYRTRLAEYWQKEMNKLDFRQGDEGYVVSTNDGSVRIFGRTYKSKQGIIVVLKTKEGNVYVRCIRVSNNPEIDMNAMQNLLNQTENTLDSLKGILLSDRKDPLTGLNKTKSGIILPN